MQIDCRLGQDVRKGEIAAYRYTRVIACIHIKFTYIASAGAVSRAPLGTRPATPIVSAARGEAATTEPIVTIEEPPAVEGIDVNGVPIIMDSIGTVDEDAATVESEALTVSSPGLRTSLLFLDSVSHITTRTPSLGPIFSTISILLSALTIYKG